MFEIINSLPMWAKLVSIFIILIFGAGGFSNLLTKIISRQKIASEANVENAEATIKISTAEKTTTELAKELIDEYKVLMEGEKTQRAKLEERIQRLENKMDDLRKESAKTTKDLKENLSKTEERLSVSEREVKLLNTYIGIIKLRWKSITDEPFPEYKSVTTEESVLE